MSISPCAYPGCRDENGDPRLTQDTFCEPCQRRYRRLLDWLREDFAKLAVLMPNPIITDVGGRRAKTSSFGHPAAWASDAKAQIAAVLNATESALREHLGHGDAPPEDTGEMVRVRHAWLYLTDRFDDLCSFPAAEDVAIELRDMHRTVYVGLGETRMAERLPVRCPQCDTLRMVRTVGQVYCQQCGLAFPEAQYERLALIVASEVRNERDAALARWLASRTG